MSGRGENELGRSTHRFVRQHARLILTLPEPPETWSLPETAVDPDRFPTLYHSNALECVEKNPNGVANVWRVDRRVYEIARDIAADLSQLPCCGATGITNDGGTVRCIECGEPHDPETAREVLC